MLYFCFVYCLFVLICSKLLLVIILYFELLIISSLNGYKIVNVDLYIIKELLLLLLCLMKNLFGGSNFVVLFLILFIKVCLVGCRRNFFGVNFFGCV